MEPKIEKTAEEAKKPAFGRKKKTEEVVDTNTDASKKRNNVQTDPYYVFAQTHPIITPDDAAIYKKGEGAIVVMVDPTGKCVIDVSFYLKKSILDNLAKAR